MTADPSRPASGRQPAPEPHLVHDAGATLGESPVWDAARGLLWWIDCATGWLHRYDPSGGAAARWQLPGRPGSMAVAADGRCLLALDGTIVLFDPDALAIETLCAPLAGRARERFNDGKCDPAGRFWVGSMHESYGEPIGRLFRVGGKESEWGSFEALDDGFRVPNGPAWSPDGRQFLMSCSVADTTFAYDFDPDEGALSAKRVWAGPKTAPGYPDGAAMDADGCLWSARWDGGCVARLTPEGRLDRIVEMPCTRVTSCAFGGVRLDTLYVTTARIGLDAATLGVEPLAGGLFAVEVGATGVPVAPFSSLSTTRT